MKSSFSLRPSRAKAQIVILFAIMLVILIGFVGLAIDSGRGYGVKAKLNAAVDAAAIAAARDLSAGNNDGERIANAINAGNKFFAANFPPGFLGSQTAPVTPSIQAIHDSTGYWTVTVSATTKMPVTFMKVLRSDDVTVSAVGKTIRRDVDLILVLDTSGSLAPPTSPSSTFPSLKARAKDFVDQFSSGYDRIGLVGFASGAVLNVPFKNDFSRGFNRAQIRNAIDNLDVSGSTATAEGIRRALDELNRVPASMQSSLRVIVFFSDGAPNDVSADFIRSGGNHITGDLYSETDLPASARATRMYSYNQRDYFINTYNDIPSLPLAGLGNIALASYVDPTHPAKTRRALSGMPYDNTRCNVNKAARNMTENVANTARGQDIVIHGIPYGARLNSLEIDFCGYNQQEYGRNILKRLCNTSDSDTFNGAQPAGICPAATTDEELKAAFTAIASEILRLSM